MPTIPIRWADNTAQLRENLKSGLDQIEATKAGAEKMAKALGGENLIRAAHNYVAAVQQVGGANKLTAEWQEKVNDTVSKAIAQYTAMGKVAPAAMLALAEATKKTEEPTAGLATHLSAAGKEALTMAAGFFTAQAALAAVKGGVNALGAEVANLVINGSAVSDVTANFQRMTEQTGRLGSTLLGALRDGTHATIDDFTLMKLANQDLAAGMKLTDQQFGTLAKGAFALAQATGTDVKTALDTMNDAMLTGRTRALAMLTGKIDLTAAEEKFAKSIGSTADHLNEEGKLEAARMAILDGVSAATERLGDQIDGLDENVAQVQVTWANFHNELAKTVSESPVLAAAFNGVKDAIAGAVGADQQALVKAVAERIDDATIALMDLARVGVEAGTFLAVEAIAVAKVYGDVVQAISLVAMAFKGASLAAAEFLSIGGHVGPLKDDVGRIRQEMVDLKVAIRERGKALQEDDAAQESVRASGQKLTQTLNDLQAKMRAAKETSAAFVGPLQDTAAAHTAAADAAGKQAQFTKQTKEETSKAATELKAFNDNLQDVVLTAQGVGAVLDTINGTVLEGIRYYHDQGVSLDRLGTMYGLTKVQVEALTQSFKAEEEALKRIAALNAANAAPTVQQPHFDAAQGELPGLAQLRAYVKEVERAKAVEAEIGQRGAQGIEKIGEAAKEAAPKARALVDTLSSLAHLDFKAVFSDISNFLKGGISKIGTGFLEGIGRDIQSKLFDLAEQGLKKLWEKAKDIFGGPSPADQAGRAIVADFEKDYASAQDMINKVGAAYVANGKSAEQAQAAIQRLWAAEKLGAEATKRALEEINEVLKRQGEIADAIHSEGFQSQDEIRHAADIANAAYEEMLRSGQYTADQVDKAYRHYQELLAQLEGAAGEAARAWLKAHQSADDAAQASSDAMKSAEADLKALVDKRNALAQGIAAEAPEQVMGVIEEQQRGQLAALDKEIQDRADAYAKLADETGQKMADAIVEALRNIHIDPVHVPVQVDVPDTSKIPRDFPGPFTGEPREHDEGFASGTPDLGFKNFGAGRRVILHGLEAVVPIARAQDFAARHIPALASPSLPSFQPLPTNIVPARLTSDSQQSAIGSLLSRAQVSTSTQSQQNVSAINVTIHATDARSFEQLIRTKGAKVVVEQIVLGKEGLKELLKGAGL